MAATYYAQIRKWPWPKLVDDTLRAAENHALDIRDGNPPECMEGCDKNGHIGSSYLGSVMSIYPSGKFWMPWTTNQTADDEDRDSRWHTALDRAADKFGGWIESGEGDPTDLYFCRYWPLDELAVE